MPKYLYFILLFPKYLKESTVDIFVFCNLCPRQPKLPFQSVGSWLHRQGMQENNGSRVVNITTSAIYYFLNALYNKML